MRAAFPVKLYEVKEKKGDGYFDMSPEKSHSNGSMGSNHSKISDQSYNSVIKKYIKEPIPEEAKNPKIIKTGSSRQIKRSTSL